MKILLTRTDKEAPREDDPLINYCLSYSTMKWDLSTTHLGIISENITRLTCDTEVRLKDGDEFTENGNLLDLKELVERGYFTATDISTYTI